MIKRSVNHYIKRKEGNLGVLLNGLKGTGKTVTAKIIANTLKQPVILIGESLDNIPNCHLFINSIPQNITVFIDEYEKLFGNSSAMLTIMDGALNSAYRRVFLLTTNDLHVDKNLLERPSRIRYLKKFGHLSPQIVEEIIDDCLVHKQYKNACVKFISSLETITVDIVKAVIEEVNIHNEAPEAFSDVFNVKKLTGKYNVDIENGDDFISLVKNAVINRRPPYTESIIGEYFVINDEYVGTVGDILSWNMVEIQPMEKEGSKKSKDDRIIKEPIVVRVSDADMSHYSYTYGYGDASKRERTKLKAPESKQITELASALGVKQPFYGVDVDVD